MFYLLNPLALNNGCVNSNIRMVSGGPSYSKFCLLVRVNRIREAYVRLKLSSMQARLAALSGLISSLEGLK